MEDFALEIIGNGFIIKGAVDYIILIGGLIYNCPDGHLRSNGGNKISIPYGGFFNMLKVLILSSDLKNPYWSSDKGDIID